METIWEIDVLFRLKPFWSFLAQISLKQNEELIWSAGIRIDVKATMSKSLKRLIESRSCISWTSISFVLIVQGNVDEKMEDISGSNKRHEKGGEVCMHNHIEHVSFLVVFQHVLHRLVN